MNNKKISILGCGWLGLPLAQQLINIGHDVKGTTTSQSKIDILTSYTIQPYLIILNENKIEGNVNDFLEESEILIINIPPKLRGKEKENFVSKIEMLLPFIEKSSVSKVLLVSSTSVYDDNQGKITENTIPNPSTENGKQLLVVEDLLQKNNLFKTTILRFGGLIGNDRHPIYFLAGREKLENPEAVINLIHLDDCIAILLQIIEKEVWGEAFNAVYPYYPSRNSYYTQKAKDLNLQKPTFDSSKTSKGKIVLSDKLIEKLEYSFKEKP